MTISKAGGMVEAMQWELDHLGVPDGDLRRVTLAIAQMWDRPDRGGHMAAAAAALDAIRPITRGLYEPMTPLELQLEYTRARRQAAEHGIDVPAWEDLAEDDRDPTAPETDS